MAAGHSAARLEGATGQAKRGPAIPARAAHIESLVALRNRDECEAVFAAEESGRAGIGGRYEKFPPPAFDGALAAPQGSRADRPAVGARAILAVASGASADSRNISPDCSAFGPAIEAGGAFETRIKPIGAPRREGSGASARRGNVRAVGGTRDGVARLSGNIRRKPLGIGRFAEPNAAPDGSRRRRRRSAGERCERSRSGRNQNRRDAAIGVSRPPGRAGCEFDRSAFGLRLRLRRLSSQFGSAISSRWTIRASHSDSPRLRSI